MSDVAGGILGALLDSGEANRSWGREEFAEMVKGQRSWTFTPLCAGGPCAQVQSVRAASAKSPGFGLAPDRLWEVEVVVRIDGPSNLEQSPVIGAVVRGLPARQVRIGVVEVGPSGHVWGHSPVDRAQP